MPPYSNKPPPLSKSKADQAIQLSDKGHLKASQSSTIGHMELAARTIDLTRSTIDALSKSGVSDAVTSVIQWLVRERIDKTEYIYCVERVRGLTYPNEYGLQIQQKLSRVEARVAKVAGIDLIMSGSVGRLMAFDTECCYMVTTVAAIMAFHDHLFATETLTRMVLDTGGHEDRIQYPYSVHMTRLKPVLSKIVESIALNVVNSGHDLGTLPDAFANLCNHVLNPPEFAAVVMAIQRSKNDVLLYCGQLPGDILVWLMTHFHGTIEVSVSGRVIYEKALGLAPTKATILVRDVCKPEAGIHGNHSIELSLNVGGVFKTALRGENRTNIKGPRPSRRQTLYSLDSVQTAHQHGILQHTEKNDICLTAQAMVGWLMSIPLKINNEREFGFTEVIDDPESASLNVGSILGHWPQIMHINYGRKPQTMSIYRGHPTQPGYPQRSDADPGIGLYVDSTESMSAGDIIECFPIASTCFENIQPRCDCTNCRKRGPVGMGKPGCLRETALVLLFNLLTHAIADGFGAPDVSGLCDPKVQQAGLQRLFAELIMDGHVIWDTWFAVAASTYLGCPWNIHMMEYPEGATSLAAIQYGSLVAVSAWVDLSAELVLSESFSFVHAEGQLRGVDNEFAVVHLEKKLQTGEDVSPRSAAITPTDPLLIDLSDAYVETAIIGAAGIPYRLLTMVKSDSYRRIVDPADAIMALHRSEAPQCDHGPSEGTDITVDESSTLWTFDQLLGCWSAENEPDTTDETSKNTYITTYCDTNLKLNVAMSLSLHGCVIRDVKCCIGCAMAKLEGHPPASRRIIHRRIDERFLVRS
ncbi:MAG: hypothetical protein M1813_007423 [Trichoglossum hirsutum]|nr:MAG: hypothetical protein M1813_007423 [Trichoglossum hirsutum]